MRQKNKTKVKRLRNIYFSTHHADSAKYVHFVGRYNKCNGPEVYLILSDCEILPLDLH